MLDIAIVVLWALVILGSIVIYRLAKVWWKYRGERAITCPENHQAAGVSLDAKHAAATALKGDLKLRLSTCSRWPEKQDCGQECLFQIERAPEDCLARNILLQWYEGKNCAWCGKPVGEIHLVNRKPGLLTADKVPMEWSQIPAERLQQTLETAQPLCFTCYVTDAMMHEHPELIIDRSRPAVTGRK